MEQEPVIFEPKEPVHNFLTLAHGNKTRKAFRDEQHEIYPFVGAFEADGINYLGFGFTVSDTAETYLWGRGGMLHNIIQSWRAMKLLEQAPLVDERMLPAIWQAAYPTVIKNDIQNIAKSVPELDLEELEENRLDVLQKAPSGQELEGMLKALQEHGINVDAYELRKERAAGAITGSPRIDALILSADRHRLEAQRIEQERHKREDAQAAVAYKEWMRKVNLKRSIVSRIIGKRSTVLANK